MLQNRKSPLIIQMHKAFSQQYMCSYGNNCLKATKLMTIRQQLQKARCISCATVASILLVLHKFINLYLKPHKALRYSAVVNHIYNTRKLYRMKNKFEQRGKINMSICGIVWLYERPTQIKNSRQNIEFFINT